MYKETVQNLKELAKELIDRNQVGAAIDILNAAASIQTLNIKFSDDSED